MSNEQRGSSKEYLTLKSDMFLSMLSRGLELLRENEDEVNSLNVFPVPDGDTGTNMMLTLEAAVEQAEKKDGSLGEVASACSTGSLMGARGNSGVILSQLFRGLSAGLQGVEEANSKQIAEAFEEGVDAAYSAVMRPVEGTILTVARKAAQTAEDSADDNDNILDVLQDALHVAEETLSRTPQMLEVLQEAGVVDAGGQGLVYILQGACEALGQQISKTTRPAFEEDSSVYREDELETELDYPFDLVILLGTAGQPVREETVREQLEESGDSIVVVSNEELLKIHIHTARPDWVLRRSMQWGELVEAQVENMQMQVSGSSGSTARVQQAGASDDSVKRPSPTTDGEGSNGVEEGDRLFSVVPIVAGDGLSEIFLQRGAACTVHGGPTMNPSAEDILQVLDSNQCDDVVLLPNNPNLILVCEQVKSLTDLQVEVVPTRNIPQGLAAVSSIDSIVDMDEACWRMQQAAADVIALEVTYAVDDREFAGVSLDRGDVIGFVDGELAEVGDRPTEVLANLLRHDKCSGWQSLSVFAGDFFSPVQADEIEQQLTDVMGEQRCIDVYYGGQDHYYFIAAALRD